MTLWRTHNENAFMLQEWNQGRIQVCDWGNRHLKTYESNSIHHGFVQFEKLHLRIAI